VAWADNYPEQQLVTYDSRWASLCSEFEALLKDHLGRGWESEHVGSTSVPGLIANPAIDVAIGMPQSVRASEVSDRLRQAGWSDPGRSSLRSSAAPGPWRCLPEMTARSPSGGGQDRHRDHGQQHPHP
jgi:GrpB-like predicted nucleotidyltransferase (UPF0157 family)